MVAERDPRRVGLVIVDRTDFKRIHDPHAHLRGDQVLREPAARLREALRAAGFPARFGGDELTVVIESVGNGGPVAEATQRIRVAVHFSLLPQPGRSIAIGARVGHAVFSGDRQHRETPLLVADQRMFRQKRRR